MEFRCGDVITFYQHVHAELACNRMLLLPFSDREEAGSRALAAPRHDYSLVA